jgi:hypothetical protein
VEVAHRYLEYERLSNGGSTFDSMPTLATMRPSRRWTPDLDVGHPSPPEVMIRQM